MLRRASSKKKRWITIPIVGVLTATIVAGVLYNTSETASARVSLSGIEEINQSNSLSDPFTILEIVPSYDQAKIGYLVNGEEPAWYDDTTGTKKGVYALADMGSSDERADRYVPDKTDRFAKFGLLKDKAFSWDTLDWSGSDKAYTTYGNFVQMSEVPGDNKYDYKDKHTMTDAYKKIIHDTTDPEYKEEYTLTEILKTTNTETTGEVYDNEVVYEFGQPIGGSKCIPAFAKVGTGTAGAFYPYATEISGKKYFDWNYYRPTSIVVTKEEDGTYSSNVDLEQFLAVYVDVDGLDDDSIGLDFCGVTLLDGSDWKYKDKNGLSLTITSNEQDALKDIYEEYFDPASSYRASYPDAAFVYMSEYISYEASDVSDLYYISSIETYATLNSTYGFATPNITDLNLRIFAGQDPTRYGIDLNDPLDYHEFYYRPSVSGAEYKYVADDDTKPGTHDFVSSYTEDINETFGYSGGFTNKEVFKKYVLDRDAGNQCNETVIDVVTRTYADVSTTDIANADLIYVNGGIKSPTELIATNIVKDVNDIKAEEAKAILAAVKEDKAIVVEAQALYNLSGEDTNAHKLAIALSQDSIADTNIDAMYNAFGETTAFVNTYDATHSKTGNYTKRTVFVTPSTDNTYVDVICDPDASAEYGMAFTETITGDDNLAGYSDVVSDINNEVFYLKVVYGESGYKSLGFNEKVSYGTIIRHILNYGNRRVTTKDNYKILDIEPGYSEAYEKDTSLFGKTFYNNTNGQTYTLTDTEFTKTLQTQRDIFNENWFVNNVCEKGNAPKITVTGMSTREFVGNIADLNASYDMIYIGLDTMYLNTSQGEVDKVKVKSKNTIYNDTTMNGLVYTHVGDRMSYGVGRAKKNDSGVATGSSYRTGGNDLTFEKLRDLQSYVEAGYAVILSNDFFCYDANGNITKINDAKIDVNSYMYDFAKLCLYGVNYADEDGTVHSVDIDAAINAKNYEHGYIGKNVYLVKDLDATKTFKFNNGTRDVEANNSNLTVGTSFAENKENFVNYLNIQKLDYRVYNQPVQYYDKDDKDKKVYIAKRNGDYYLDYEVELINKAAVGTPSYDCKLYIDVNADGRFSELEAQDLTDITTSSGTPATKVNGRFTLSTGTRYYISMKVPDDYRGFLSWKLEFTENDRKSSTGVDLVKKSLTGYSAVLDDSKAKTSIKVLQLTSVTNSYGALQNHLDLTSDSMKQLYNQVQDFNIDVKSESVGDFVTKVDNDKKLQYLLQYDMIVMGFSDCYSMPISGTNGRDTYEAVYAIREYILSGRSMLFTHDLNSPYYFEKQSVWGCFLNEFIRELQGMDRYGMTKENIERLEQMTGKKCTEYASRYDDDEGYTDLWGKASTKVSNSKFSLEAGTLDKLGILYAQFGKYRNGNELGDVSSFDLRRLQHDNDATWNYNFVSKKVRMVNEGQITDYPFYIGESLDIAATHPQYFQLNLDTDSRDDNFTDDTVVWYCIDGYNNGKTASYYTMDQNDVRNNYYIYTKGNITYTGSGHATIGADKIEERKLFVNTLVAAYSAGQHAPVITYKESAWNQSSTISALYEPFDVNLENDGSDSEGGALGNTVTVNFKAANNNLLNNRERVTDASGTSSYQFKKINVEYYVPDTNGAYTINGVKVSKIPANDIVLKMKVDSTGNVLDNPVTVDNIFALDNGAIYTAEIKNSYFLKTSSNADGNLVLDSHSSALYIRASMDAMDEMRTPTDATASTILPGTESFNELAINYTELYELK